LGVPSALLITAEDGCLQDFNLQSHDIVATATLAASHLRSPLVIADHVTAFEAGSLADTAARAGFSVDTMTAGDPGALAQWAAKAGARQIITPYITQGPLHDFIAQAAPALALRGIALCEWRRDYDAAVWPLATAGFFKVRQNIPNILAKTVPDWARE
jgi:deoxyribodipyrimidine photo-lyase